MPRAKKIKTCKWCGREIPESRYASKFCTAGCKTMCSLTRRRIDVNTAKVEVDQEEKAEVRHFLAWFLKKLEDTGESKEINLKVMQLAWQYKKELGYG